MPTAGSHGSFIRGFESYGFLHSKFLVAAVTGYEIPKKGSYQAYVADAGSVVPFTVEKPSSFDGQNAVVISGAKHFIGAGIGHDLNSLLSASHYEEYEVESLLDFIPHDSISVYVLYLARSYNRFRPKPPDIGRGGFGGWGESEYGYQPKPPSMVGNRLNTDMGMDNRLITKNPGRNMGLCTVGLLRKSRFAPNTDLGMACDRNTSVIVPNTVQFLCGLCKLGSAQISQCLLLSWSKRGDRCFVLAQVWLCRNLWAFRPPVLVGWTRGRGRGRVNF